MAGPFCRLQPVETRLSGIPVVPRPGSEGQNLAHANPRVDELIKGIGASSLTYARDALIEEVWKIVQNDIVYLPLHHQVLVGAMHENLDLPISPLAIPIFREARLKAGKTN